MPPLVKRWTVPVLIALFVVSWALIASGQGQVMPPPKFTAYDSNGDPCAGCKLYTYAAGTTTPQSTYTSSTLGTANANPVVLDAAGRATVFVDPTLAYKFVLKTAADVDIYTVDSVVGPFSGQVTINAPFTRGLIVTRSSADAGLQIASSGGSGKTYAITSTTAGALRIQDDSDSTPRFEISGDNANVTLTGTFTIGGGLLAVNGFGAHSFSAGGTGANYILVRNTTAGTTMSSGFNLGNDATASASVLAATSSTYTTSGYLVQDSTILQGSRTGGLSVVASDAAGDVRVYTGGSTTARMTIDQDGNILTGAQPMFLAYNAADDAGQVNGAIVEFDTEVFDRGGDYNGTNTFTAPVTGIYHLCAAVQVAPGGVYETTAAIVTSNRTYELGPTSASSGGATRPSAQGCVYADMDASDTAHVIFRTTDAGGAGAIQGGSGAAWGGAEGVMTYFSGKLAG